MRGREITLWLDERWYDALSKQLKGETLEEHLENILDEMCNQLPQREYERISHELWAEQQAEEEAREAARRFAVFHVTENGSSDYILAEENLELLSTARRLRSYIRKPPDEAPHRFVETLLHTQRDLSGGVQLLCVGAAGQHRPGGGCLRHRPRQRRYGSRQHHGWLEAVQNPGCEHRRLLRHEEGQRFAG
ncbi:MAG: hypothetical protein V8Q30_03170 [Acutalibacteraceae bacterium]